jgi:rhamnose transport system permease protein
MRREIAVAAALLIVCVILLIAAPRFFQLENQTDLLLANIPVLIVAVGMTMVILTGQIDISVGSQFAICAVVAGALAKTGLPVTLAALATCALGGLLGSLNGALVSYVRIPSIVVTLASMVALRDALRWTTEGAWVEDLPQNFQWFGLSQTGINAKAVTFWVFVITGALTGCAAVLNAVRFNQIPSNSGIGLELKAIAAVVVGGTVITGGRGTILGTLLGVTLLGIIGPGLTFLGVSAYWERAIQGAIILAAVALDTRGRQRV